MKEARRIRFRISRLLGAMACVAWVAGVQAHDLKWDEMTISRTPLLGEKKVVVVFPFTNTGTEPVEVKDIRISCNCTTAEVAKKVIGPGEKSELKAVMTIGTQSGHQEKTILVQTAERDNVPYILLLKVDLPETVRIDKEKLTWALNGPLETQTVEVTIPGPTAVRVRGVSAASPNFSPKLEEVDAGKTYRVQVTPVSTDKPVKGEVLLEVADPEERTISLPVAVE